MITERTGDMFTSKAQVLVQGVNTKGVMGAGIAKQFREKFPDMYESYRIFCEKGWLNPGDVHTSPNIEELPYFQRGKPEFIIANIASQDLPGPNARLSWLSIGLNSLFFNLSGWNYLVAIPQIGCGIGGLNWADVKPMIIDYANYYDIDVELWTYGG